MNTKLVIFSIIALTQSTSAVSRNVSGLEQINPPQLNDLLKASELISIDVGHKSFPEICVQYLSKLEKSVDALDLKSLSKTELIKNAERIADNSWKIRSHLHSRLHEFNRECSIQVQSNFRQFRFIEDYLLELFNQVTHLTPDKIDFQHQPIPMLDQSPAYYVLKTTEAGEGLKFAPGDMLVTRGVSFLSGMIARLGDRGTQFSHIVWVDKDNKQQLRTIESYVGVGVGFYDFNFALKNENARILWLRAKDKKMAAKASSAISKLVKEKLASKRPIKYDYELNFNDPTTMSCAEVSQVAFEMASAGQFKIPQYPNVISGGRSLIDRLKIKPGPTYEPGDMEIDPRFELMGEFQDLRLTRDSRQKDAIMSEMFRWMNEHNYELKDTMKSKMAGGIIYTLRRTFLWPLVKKMLKLEDFSKEIPRNMIRTVTLVSQIGETIHSELKLRDEAFEKIYGLPMSAVALTAELEKMRKEDLELYKNKKTRKQAKFHRYFRNKR